MIVSAKVLCNTWGLGMSRSRLVSGLRSSRLGGRCIGTDSNIGRCHE